MQRLTCRYDDVCHGDAPGLPQYPGSPGLFHGLVTRANNEIFYCLLAAARAFSVRCPDMEAHYGADEAKFQAEASKDSLDVRGGRGFFGNGGRRIGKRARNECTVATHRTGNCSR